MSYKYRMCEDGIDGEIVELAKFTAEWIGKCARYAVSTKLGFGVRAGTSPWML